MRMWQVDPSLMCDRHLLGEHAETHMFVGSMRAGKSMAGYVSRGLLDTRRLEQRHGELADEMLARGMRHASPLPTFSAEWPGEIDVPGNLAELARRCERCAERQDA